MELPDFSERLVLKYRCTWFHKQKYYYKIFDNLFLNLPINTFSILWITRNQTTDAGLGRAFYCVSHCLSLFLFAEFLLDEKHKMPLSRQRVSGSIFKYKTS
jgi:hypothetical protein